MINFLYDQESMWKVLVYDYTSDTSSSNILEDVMHWVPHNLSENASAEKCIIRIKSI